MMNQILSMNYDPEVDSAYYQLDTTPGIDSEEIAEGIVVDYDADNNVVGVELLGLKTLNHKGFEALSSLLPTSVKTQFLELLNTVAFV